MQELLQMAPQLGVAAFIVGAVIFLRREQQKNGGITRTEFTAAIDKLDGKLDRLDERQRKHGKDLAVISSNCTFHREGNDK